MAVHKPGTIYGLRKLASLSGYVRTISADEVQIVMHQPKANSVADAPPQVLELSRKDARLLAKRINHCLDDTRTKGNK